MNLWFRLIALLFTSWRGSSLTSTNDVSRVRARVWPNDLDTSLHMNNGRYLTLMDLGRMDWTVRSGLLKVLWERKWIPVATTATCRFVREMRCWTKFRIESRIVGWVDSQLFFEHRIVFESGKREEQLAALALVKAGIYDRKARRMIPIDELLELTSIVPDRPAMRGDIEAFLELEGRMNAIGKGEA